MKSASPNNNTLPPLLNMLKTSCRCLGALQAPFTLFVPPRRNRSRVFHPCQVVMASPRHRPHQIAASFPSPPKITLPCPAFLECRHGCHLPSPSITPWCIPYHRPMRPLVSVINRSDGLLCSLTLLPFFSLPFSLPPAPPGPNIVPHPWLLLGELIVLGHPCSGAEQHPMATPGQRCWVEPCMGERGWLWF